MSSFLSYFYLYFITLVDIFKDDNILHVVGFLHKVLIYLEYQSGCPLVGIGTPHGTPLPSSVCVPPPPPNQRVGGTNSLAGEGVGESHSEDMRKSLAFCLVHCGCLFTSGQVIKDDIQRRCSLPSASISCQAL